MKLYNRINQSWKQLSSPTRKRLLTIASFLFFSNIAVWVVGLLVAHSHPLLFGLLVLSYGLGLRHAIDADHIAAIDNTTRKFIGEGKKPLSIGLFFALGHATVVIFLSLFIAIASAYMQHNFPLFKTVGFLLGASVSSFFLLVIGFINLMSFFNIVHSFKKASQRKKQHEVFFSAGPFSKLFRFFFHMINKSWHMYFVGFMFGLGFDTATEVGLLSLSALNGIAGTSLWIILLLPLLFTAGMTLLDTFDGILMLGMYRWAYIKPARRLYYNLNITLFSVFIAFLISGIQIMTIISTQFKIQNTFFRFINSLDLGEIGYLIILLFIIFWIISIGIYKIKGYDKLV